ncbi:hypothetical protein A3F34_01415 [Candidatus Roizmanbacteria bacterium RIFCSPHIGHO2_12_FULL_44_10]|uniref:LysM domain-containing protein n=1 Tax=Candidatus Roizmanbacteria bacterium RIFCSPHIGHO2_12_FULL_44_10 TaxID=1802054 RepID=A0A1F7I6P8_9BACT|nr:MAG: hypothetical protein A3F34_01415 [Candidatus Roizmanbacteria bacterium RIFCSPHIGHO2_12_FULL_44_10]
MPEEPAVSVPDPLNEVPTDLELENQEKLPSRALGCVRDIGFAVLAVMSYDKIRDTDYASRLYNGANIVISGLVQEIKDLGSNPVLVFEPPVEATEEPAGGAVETTMYTVKPGDSLSAIAAQLPGNPDWHQIYELNKGIIGPNPSSLSVGTIIRLPGGGEVALSQADIDNLEPARLNDEALPADVVSRSELHDKYHTTIWDAKGEVNLHLRSEAMKMLIFQAAQSGYFDELNIILINGPIVDYEYLSDETRVALPEFANKLQDGKISSPDKNTAGVFVQYGRHLYVAIALGGSLNPDLQDSHPHPDKYSFELTDAYPFKAQDLALLIRHELNHYSGSNETTTDYSSLEQVRQARMRYEKSGETDDSLYFAVFETPNGNLISQGPDKLDQRVASSAPARNWTKIHGDSIEAIKARLQAHETRKAT